MERVEITSKVNATNTKVVTTADLPTNSATTILSSIPNIILLTEAISMGWEIDKIPAFDNGSSRYWVLTDDIGNEIKWPGEWNQSGMVSFSSDVAARIRIGIDNHKERIYLEGKNSNARG